MLEVAVSATLSLNTVNKCSVHSQNAWQSIQNFGRSSYSLNLSLSFYWHIYMLYKCKQKKTCFLSMLYLYMYSISPGVKHMGENFNNHVHVCVHVARPKKLMAALPSFWENNFRFSLNTSSHMFWMLREHRPFTPFFLLPFHLFLGRCPVHLKHTQTA